MGCEMRSIRTRVAYIHTSNLIHEWAGGYQIDEENWVGLLQILNFMAQITSQ